MSKIVQLRAAKIPKIGFLAIHYWFVISQDSTIERWEIWQKANVSQNSWGHLHKNLMKHDQGVGNGNSWIEKEWTGKNADLLAKIIKNSPQKYLYNHIYRYWPGPNSNTYIQWIFNQANINYDLNSRGIGKDYLGLICLRKTSKIMQFYTPIFGIKFRFNQGLELHFLTLTFGININPFMVKTPLKTFFISTTKNK